MDDVRLELMPSAKKVMDNMEQRVRDVAQAYGEHSPEHVEMLKSLIQALRSILRLGGKIYWDSELSLIGVSWITYGVIFHPKYIDGKTRDPLLGDWSVHS